jgi:hypothetical protein
MEFVEREEEGGGEDADDKEKPFDAFWSECSGLFPSAICCNFFRSAAVSAERARLASGLHSPAEVLSRPNPPARLTRIIIIYPSAGAQSSRRCDCGGVAVVFLLLDAGGGRKPRGLSRQEGDGGLATANTVTFSVCAGSEERTVS